MKTELAVSAARANSPAALIPTTMNEAIELSKAIHDSHLAPRGIDTPQKIFVCVCHGLEVGLPPMAAIQSIAVINGRPSMWGEALLGLVHASGKLDDMEETFDEETMTATCRMIRKGQSTPIIYTFSKADAEAAGLWGKAGPWSQYPKRMLQMRARGFAIRDGFADVTKGLAVREEMQDIIDATPADKEVQRQSRLADLQTRIGGPTGEGFDAEAVDLEIDAAQKSVPKLIREVHVGIYSLQTQRAINTFYRNNFESAVKELPDDDREVIESIVLKHLERIDGTVSAEDAAAYVKDCIRKAEGQ